MQEAMAQPPDIRRRPRTGTCMLNGSIAESYVLHVSRSDLRSSWLARALVPQSLWKAATQPFRDRFSYFWNVGLPSTLNRPPRFNEIVH